MNERIVHDDVMNLGIVFLNKTDEFAFLKRVNDEFAYLVGLEALNRITGSKNEEGTERVSRFSDKSLQRQRLFCSSALRRRKKDFPPRLHILRHV